MGKIAAVVQKAAAVHKVGKIIAVAASTGAAIVSVVTALYSYGVIGKSEALRKVSGATRANCTATPAPLPSAS